MDINYCKLWLIHYWNHLFIGKFVEGSS